MFPNLEFIKTVLNGVLNRIEKVETKLANGTSQIHLDTTLKEAGKAADAAAVGERLSSLSEDIAGLSVGGISATARGLLITILQNGVFTSDQSANITALEAALGGASGGDSGGDSGGGSGEAETTTYTITNELTNVTSDNSATSISKGESYTANLTAADGYSLDTVTITMGGMDITSTAYADGAVGIAAVTGDVVITAAAIEIVSEITYELGGKNYKIPSVSTWTDENETIIDAPATDSGIYFLSVVTFETDTQLSIERNYSSTIKHLVYYGSYNGSAVVNTKVIEVQQYAAGTIVDDSYTVKAGCQLVVGFGNAVSPTITVKG